MNKPVTEKRRGGLFPSSLGRLTDMLVKPALKKRGFAEHRLLTDWPMIVGEECARFATPKKLSFPRSTENGRAEEGGTLHVDVLSAYALELQYQQPAILEKITQYFGYRAITRIVMHQTQNMRKQNPLPERPARPGREADLRSLRESLENF